MEATPDYFMDAVLGYQKTAALKAALGLDLFTAIGEVGGEIDRIARRTNASRRGIRILCDYLCVIGFLEKEGDQYRLSPMSRIFLTKSSPAWMGSIVDFIASPEMIALWLEDPVSFVRNGGSLGLAAIAPDNPIWVKFAKAMVPFIMPVADAMVERIQRLPKAPKHVLDVAAGHGLFGITVAKTVPDAQITAIDWPAVLAVAQENADAAGVSIRYRARPGSAFDLDWGSDFDLVLLTNFLHHFDWDTCIGLLVKARNSLKPDGRVIGVEFVPNEDRVSPPFPAMFSFMMLGSTPKGDAYTAHEFQEMGQAAGFGRTLVEPVPSSPQCFVIFDQIVSEPA